MSAEHEGWQERLAALDLHVVRLVKPPQTVRLYGLLQRLQVKRMRLDGSADALADHDREAFALVPDLSAADCAFLHRALQRIVDGERDAFRAFELQVHDQRQASIRPRIMAAEYELRCRVSGVRSRKPHRSIVAEAWDVSQQRVAQAWAAHEAEVTDWIARALSLADHECIPRDAMLAHVCRLVISARDSPFTKGGASLKNTPPEVLFNIEFPAPLPPER